MMLEEKPLLAGFRRKVKILNLNHFHSPYLGCGLYTCPKNEYSTTAVD
jgi:hypothetical protein